MCYDQNKTRAYRSSLTHFLFPSFSSLSKRTPRYTLTLCITTTAVKERRVLARRSHHSSQFSHYEYSFSFCCSISSAYIRREIEKPKPFVSSLCRSISAAMQRPAETDFGKKENPSSSSSSFSFLAGQFHAPKERERRGRRKKGRRRRRCGFRSTYTHYHVCKKGEKGQTGPPCVSPPAFDEHKTLLYEKYK